MPEANKVELSEELQNALKEICRIVEKEDAELRKSQIRTWKKTEEYWHGLQMVFWSELDQSWISPDSVHFEDIFTDEEISQLGPIYDYVIDIYRAHGESLIAALSSNIPSLRYRPDDADSEMDRLTATTFSKIADLVSIHNKAPLLFVTALYYFYNMGIVASYIYKVSDPKFGVNKVPKFETRSVPNPDAISKLECPNCRGPREENDGQCPECESADIPVATEPENSSQDMPVKVGEELVPKTRVIVENYGPLHVKVPFYASDQDAMGYLQLTTDQNKNLMKSLFPDAEEKIEAERLEDMTRFPRSIYSYPHDLETETLNLVSVQKTWLRPWMFWQLDTNHKKEREELINKFPNGVQVTLLGKGKVFLEAYNESLDSRWTIGQCGPSTYIHSDPIGKGILQIQDIRNQMVNITIDTAEHQIPAEFADPEVVDFDAYGKFEALPGYMYPAKPRPGQNLGNSFYTQVKASLSKEVPMIFQQLDRDAQFTIGDFPSVHGGPAGGKTRTLGEYAMSKQMALQRLSVAWQFILDWYIRTIDLATRTFAESVQDEERYSKKGDQGSFINVWIKKAEMLGQVGGIAPESSDTFPVSIVQKHQTVLELMKMNNPSINAALYNPVNARLIKDIIALEEFVIPGDEQRSKQAFEIYEMTRPGVEPQQGQSGNWLPSIPIDPDVDDNGVHIEVLKSFLVGSTGIDLKTSNPPGYMNCLAHLKMHQLDLKLKTAQAFEASKPGQQPDSSAGSTVEEPEK